MVGATLRRVLGLEVRVLHVVESNRRKNTNVHHADPCNQRILLAMKNYELLIGIKSVSRLVHCYHSHSLPLCNVDVQHPTIHTYRYTTRTCLTFDAKTAGTEVLPVLRRCQLAGPQCRLEHGLPKLMNACVESCLVGGHLRVGSSKLPAARLPLLCYPLPLTPP